MANVAPSQPTLRSVSAVPSSPRTLDDLAKLSTSDLASIYAGGSIPSSFADFGRHPRGRVLAVRYLDNRVAALLVRRIAALSVFPWRGKTLAATARYTGDGINRIRVGISTNWFEFAMQVEPSVIDGEDTVVFNYAGKGNPWLISIIRDELREIETGLFVGPAMLRTPRGPVTALWFALDGR